MMAALKDAYLESPWGSVEKSVQMRRELRTRWSRMISFALQLQNASLSSKQRAKLSASVNKELDAMDSLEECYVKIREAIELKDA